MTNYFSSSWLEARELRQAAKSGHPYAPSTPWSAAKSTEEAELHARIKAELDYRRWLYVHCRMDVPTTFDEPGVPDFLIFAPGPRLILPEIKTRTGKLTHEQVIWHHRAKLAGFEPVVVRSFEEFMEVVR